MARPRPFAHPFMLLATGLLFAAFVLGVLPAQARAAKAYTPPRAAFDLSFAYTPREALDRAARYDIPGRFAAIASRWSFDLLWPAVYGLFVFSAWSFVLERLGKGVPPENDGQSRMPPRGFAALALLGTGFDYVENVAVTLLLASVPERPLGWAFVAAVATPLKWIFVGVGLGGGAVLLGIWGIGRLRKTGVPAA